MNKLEAEEKEILEAFDAGTLKPVKNRARELARHRQLAAEQQRPFAIKVPNLATRAAMEEARAMTRARIANAGELLGDPEDDAGR